MLLILTGTGVAAIPAQCMAQSTGGDTSVNNRTEANGFVKPTPKDSGTSKASREPIITTDTVVKKGGPFQPNPKKAGLYSALIPGLGQLYNRQYWKIPIVYAGLGTVGYLFVKTLKEYQSYRKAYLGRINNPYPTDEYVTTYPLQEQLQQIQSDKNKSLNLTVLFGTLGYALQVMDAITAAHLKNFDISRDISMRISPVVTPQGIGMGLVMNIKNKAPFTGSR